MAVPGFTPRLAAANVPTGGQLRSDLIQSFGGGRRNDTGLCKTSAPKPMEHI